MTGFGDKIAWDLKCPHCSQKFKASLSELENDPLLTCPNCGNGIQIESGGTAKETAEAVKQIDKTWNDIVSGFKKRR